MIFKLGLFEKKTTLKTLKIITISLLIIGIILIALSLFGPEFMRHAFISGVGTGLIFVVVLLCIKYLTLRKREDFKEELEASFSDERMIIQRMKAITISNLILVGLIVLMLSVSVFYNFSFEVGGFILLTVYMVTLLGLKIHFNNKGGKE